jgi:hypothetical protein
MFLAVTAANGVLTTRVPSGVALGAEVLIGGVVYIASAFVFARSNVREMLRLVRSGRNAAA